MEAYGIPKDGRVKVLRHELTGDVVEELAWEDWVKELEGIQARLGMDQEM